MSQQRVRKPVTPKNAQNTKSVRSRYKNPKFLKALGNYCRQLRVQRGFSIDRLSKESDQLSVASIDRLERGLADSQTLVLVRYAEALELSLIDLFAFLKDNPSFSKDSRIIPYERDIKPSIGYVPVFPIKVAAGFFPMRTFMKIPSQLAGWMPDYELEPKIILHLLFMENPCVL